MMFLTSIDILRHINPALYDRANGLINLPVAKASRNAISYKLNSTTECWLYKFSLTSSLNSVTDNRHKRRMKCKGGDEMELKIFHADTCLIN